MQGGYAVDGVAAHDGQVGHAHLAVVALLDQGHLLHAGQVVRPAQGDLLEEAGVDLVDDLQMARQHLLHQAHRPALQGLRQQGMVGVAEGAGGDVPGLLPRQIRLVHEVAHQLGHRHGGMGVVELDGVLLGKGVPVRVVLAVAADDVAHRAGDQEVLLDEAQLLARVGGVGGIEHLGDGLRPVLLLHRLHVFALVEHIQAEALGGARAPQAQHVDRVHPEADDRHVVGHAFQHLPVHPDRLLAAAHGGHVLDAAIDQHGHGVLGAHHLPRVAELQPVVRALLLPAVLELLAEQAVLVAEAVAVAGILHGGQRIEEAGGQAAQAAVAQAGVRLLAQQSVEVDLQVLQGGPGGLGDAQGGDVVLQQAAQQELHGDVVEALDVVVHIGALGGDHAVHGQLAHGQGEADLLVVIGGAAPVFATGVGQVVDHTLADGAGGYFPIHGLRRLCRCCHIRFLAAGRHLR